MRIETASGTISKQDGLLVYPSFKRMVRLSHQGMEEQEVQALFEAIFYSDDAAASEMTQRICHALSPKARLESDWVMNKVLKSVRRIPSTASKEEVIEIASNALANSFEAVEEKKKRQCTACNAPNKLSKTEEDKIVWKIKKCCDLAQYCSQECTEKDWLSHQAEHLNPFLK